MPLRHLVFLIRSTNNINNTQINTRQRAVEQPTANTRRHCPTTHSDIDRLSSTPPPSHPRSDLPGRCPSRPPEAGRKHPSAITVHPPQPCLPGIPVDTTPSTSPPSTRPERTAQRATPHERPSPPLYRTRFYHTPRQCPRYHPQGRLRPSLINTTPHHPPTKNTSPREHPARLGRCLNQSETASGHPPNLPPQPQPQPRQGEGRESSRPPPGRTAKGLCGWCLRGGTAPSRGE